jgi:histone deacetylase 11
MRLTDGGNSKRVRRAKQPIVGVRRLFNYAILVFFLSIIAWVAYINRPRAAYEVAILTGLTPVSLQGASRQENAHLGTASPPQAAERDDQQTVPFNVAVVYSPGYLIDLGGLEKAHPFDIKKYQKIHDGLKSDGLLSDEQTFKPEPLTNDDLLLIHTQGYLDDLKQRTKIAQYLEARELLFAPVSLERAVVAPFRRASGGTMLAARVALKVGIGVNIGGGYHHAKPDRGEGFCLFADVPIAIRKLQKEGLINRAVIVDVDVHQGNGTILCLENDDTTFTFSMHQQGIYPMPKEKGDLDVELRAGMNDVQYMQVLNKHLSNVLDDSKADICFIVGGCDTLKGDPLASLQMTKSGIVKRDHAIIEACVKRKIPVVLTLSGGYSPKAWESQYLSIKNLVETYKLSDERPAVTKTKKEETAPKPID